MPVNGLSELDKRLILELQEFLPEKIFDAHAHLWKRDACVFPPGCEIAEGMEGTAQSWRRCQERIFGPRRLTGALFLGEPRCRPDVMNDFLVEALKGEPQSRGAILITPEYPKDKAIEYLKHPAVAGFKPYHTFSPEKPTYSSSVSGFLPEWAWELADERGLVIVLHLVKELALSDPLNQKEIRDHCEKYPGAKVILAHAGRGFHAPNTVRGISSLRGLENICFDTSGICEPGPLIAVLEEFGPGKLLWGSDFWISEIRGKAVTAGDGFVWLTDRTVHWPEVSPECRATLVGIESLRALSDAAGVFGLNRDDIRNIFHDNAVSLLGVETKPDHKTQFLYERAKEIIPGGTQLLSKRPEMFAPGLWPAYFAEARGCEVWDLDGRHYYDISTNGISSCLLGYRDPDVAAAVKRRINLGSMSSLNPPEEVALAETLIEIHPWAGQVRYARSGGEAMAVAVRIARATTDRSGIAVCGYSGWQDWYLAANLGEDDSLRGHLLPGLKPLGVPRELRGTTLTFRYDSGEELCAAVSGHGKNLAAIVMEPCRYHDPEPGFLEEVIDRAHQAGALVIFDEITIGWRLVHGGSHLKFGIFPDIAVFAKAMGNGHPMAAIIGTSAAMEGAHTSFISSTYWTEGVGPAAALAAIGKMKKTDVCAHIAGIGSTVMRYWKSCGKKHGLPVVVEDGYPCLAHFRFEHELGNAMRTYYTQIMLEMGFLAGTQFSPTLAHTEGILSKYETALDAVFAEISDAVAKGDLTKRLKGPEAHTGFARLL